MKKRIVFLLGTAVLIATILIMLKGYLLIIPDAQGTGYPSSVSDFNQTGEYQFDPERTLTELDKASLELRTPVPITLEVYEKPLPEGSSFLWDSSVYMKIAELLKNQIWGDGMPDWELYRMYFYADCQTPLNGFSIGDFVYFKPVQKENGYYYDTRELVIRPLYGRINWGSGNSYPRPLLGWKKIDQDKIRVAADEALQIAEDNGGRDARLAVNNECSISLSYNPNVNSNDWILVISHNNELPNIFKIQIDPYTGKSSIAE